MASSLTPTPEQSGLGARHRNPPLSKMPRSTPISMRVHCYRGQEPRAGSPGRHEIHHDHRVLLQRRVERLSGQRQRVVGDRLLQNTPWFQYQLVPRPKCNHW